MSWLSIDASIIGLISIGYLSLLFFAAYWAQKTRLKSLVSNSWVYGLSLGVSCTSWAFYGVIGQASNDGYWLSPIYIGTIGFVVLCWPVLLKLLRVSRQFNLSSLADLLATRYESQPRIAVLVTLITLLGTIPYIALQLRAISHSFDLVTGSYRSGTATMIVVTLVLVGFSILFGARTASINRQNPGLVFAIAISSLIKLFALIAVGLFATFFVFDGVGDLMQAHAELSFDDKPDSYSLLAQISLGALTVFTTPALFHMIVIENHSEEELQRARWLYPVYLILINLFVLPLAISGLTMFPGGAVNADSFALTIPLFQQQAAISIIVYLGGLAAAISMVIVAGLVLSNMVTTDLLTPILVNSKLGGNRLSSPLARQLLLLRRLTIAAVLLMALAFEQFLDQTAQLANLGLLAFVLLSQLGPAILGGLYWKNASSRGAMAGLLTGALVWGYCLLLPTIAANADLVLQGPRGLAWLRPEVLFGIDFLEPVTHGTLMSLISNILVFVLVSVSSERSVTEKLQANLFVKKSHNRSGYKLTNQDLITLLARFIDKQSAREFSEQLPTEVTLQQQASREAITHVEAQLASVLGNVSTRLVLDAATGAESSPMALDRVADFVSEATQLFQFNRELLQAAVENIEQGIAVVDTDMRLVAWNNSYQSLLDYPDDYLQVNMPIRDVLRFNKERGIFDGESAVDQRLQHMRTGQNHFYRRVMPSGKVVEIRGQAMPGGGYVSTFSDISRHVQAERALQLANETLEARVAARTRELAAAKQQAEAANRSKTRFLAAASHDLMQPFNALSLFTDMLHQRLMGTESEKLSDQIKNSLSHVEALLSDLVEIAKLDSSEPRGRAEVFPLNRILQPLADEIAVIAQRRSIAFSYQQTSLWVESDPKLLRRVVQNLLTNAIQYVDIDRQKVTGMSRVPRVLLGVRRHQQQANIQILDNGPGIPEEKQALIFKEFERLDQDPQRPGLGLGLAICERIAALLQTSINLYSTAGKGSCFSISVPVQVRLEGSLATAGKSAVDTPSENTWHNPVILIVDNDALSLEALREQLRAWGCEVIAWTDRSASQTVEPHTTPAIIIADYHLDNDDDGITLVGDLKRDFGWQSPAVICSADPSEDLRQACIDNGLEFLRKPIKALALKKLIKTYLHT